MTSASPDAVWKVLADGWRYPTWVVGAARIRAVGADWPAVGSQLHHSLGGWPVLIDDSTRVETVSPGSKLVLRGRGWPLGEVEISLLLEPADDGGCEIVMREDVVSGPTRLMPRALRALLMGPRNRETLNRLAYLAEARSR
ncbi:MAG TPA: SRPBCC family protein [Pseudonocardia sp.]|nr:SRPBCC family protein [Pseudonocardia sp.]